MSSSEGDGAPQSTSERATRGMPRFSVDNNTMRVLISTDNHLGYAERDPVRGNDSFAAFEEIMYLAQKFSVDMVLIAGDLFHENRPTRHTMHKTMEIMRRYCMGPNPVKIRMLSEPAKNFRSGTVNYLDPNYSVHLPVFSIHGNHDDPSRDAGCRDLLAALDLLSVSNLINYFGRQDEVDKIEISPLLIEKGSTRLAIYGMGSMRDARLHRMWANKKVQFMRPEEDDEVEKEEGFFNIFALHQNRDLGRGAKNCVQEHMIPDWMDLVIWGHEHECLIDFSESVVGTFRISQPGSSVATSLVAGEAVRKKIGIIDIKGKRFRMHTIPLTQVRAFVTCDISLKEHRANLDPEDPKIDDKINSILEKEVQVAVKNARDRMEEMHSEARAVGNDAAEDDSPLQNLIAKPDEVLVRIRVEHSGFATINNQRFGARFVGEVANANDILLFHRRKEIKAATTKLTDKQRRSFLKNPIDPENIERLNMEDLVLEFFDDPKHTDRTLKMLDKKKLTESLGEFVDKNANSTIDETTDLLIKEKQKVLMAKLDQQDASLKGSEIREILEEDRVKKTESDKSQDRPGRMSTDTNSSHNESIEKDQSFEDEAPAAASARKPVSKPKTSQSQRVRAKPTVDLLSSDEDDEDHHPIGKSTKNSGKAAPRAAPRPARHTAPQKKTYTLDSDEDDFDSGSDAPMDEDDDCVEIVPRNAKAPAKKKSKTAAPTYQARKASQLTSKKARSMMDESDSDSVAGGLGTESFENEHWGTAATRSQL